MTTRPIRRSVLVAGALAVALVVVACNAEAPSPSPATPSPSPTSSPSTSAPAAPRPSATGGLLVDESLLGALPAEIDGLPLEPVPEAAAQIAADPNLRRDAVAVAVAMVVALTEETEDFAVASVVELGDGVFDADFHGAWRDSYDEAACEPAGGVARRAETRIGGRDVSVATCEQGARTYHVHLADPDRMVSITSVGERDFGERIIADMPTGS